MASLKDKLQETTGIKVGWQVLLLGGAPTGPGFGRLNILVFVCCWVLVEVNI